MFPFHKKAVTVILGPRSGEPSQDGEDADSSTALNKAAEDLIRAVHSKDPAAVVAALESAFASLKEADEPADSPQEPERS